MGCEAASVTEEEIRLLLGGFVELKTKQVKGSSRGLATDAAALSADMKNGVRMSVVPMSCQARARCGGVRGLHGRSLLRYHPNRSWWRVG